MDKSNDKERDNISPFIEECNKCYKCSIMWLLDNCPEGKVVSYRLMEQMLDCFVSNVRVGYEVYLSRLFDQN